MTATDCVKLLNLCGAAFLFFSSLRAQRWTKQQADALSQVAENIRIAVEKRSGNGSANATKTGSTKYVSQEALDQHLAAVISAPYFDTRAFFYLCIGFLVSTIAAGWDFLSSGALSRTYHALFG